MSVHIRRNITTNDFVTFGFNRGVKKNQYNLKVICMYGGEKEFKRKK